MKPRTTARGVAKVTAILAAAGLAAATLLTSGAATAQNCAYPNMLVVLDQSSSMTATLQGSGQTKWRVVKAALEQVLAEHDDAIHFGLMPFPYPDRCDPGDVVVDVGGNSAAAFSSFLADDPPDTGNFTPLLQTLEAVASYAPLLDPTVDNYVLLITDGEQWCSDADTGVYNTDVAPKVSVLRSLGITTYVVGLSSGVNPCMLGDAAVRGGTALPSCDWDHRVDGCDWTASRECYYQADDPTTLLQALSDIAREISGEVCDGIDNDCDGVVDGLERACATSCGAGVERCEDGVWGACDAAVPASEVCDGRDNDCDGQTDEGLRRNCQTVCGGGTETCTNGTWGGCDAPQPLDEACDDLVDNDCDGQTDEDCGDCVSGETRPCGNGQGVCEQGTQTCVANAWGPCEEAVLPAGETCNNLDDDCDGATDEGLWRTCANTCGEGIERCAAGVWGECDAPQPVPEVCNDIDDDCDGLVDDGLFRPCENVCGTGRERCERGAWVDCDARTSTPEFCNGIDDDCDGKIDQGDLCPSGFICVDGTCAPDPNAPGPDVVAPPADAGDGGGADTGAPDVLQPSRTDTGEPSSGPGVSGDYEGEGRMVSGVSGAAGCQAGATSPAAPATTAVVLLLLFGGLVAVRRVRARRRG